MVEAMHQAALGAFGIPAVWTPQGGGTPVAITGVIQKPAMLEDVLPGSAAVIRFFVDFNDAPPTRGDTVTLNGTVYMIADMDVDIEGGAVLKLRVT
jgi:hypothetical protein